MQSTYLCHTDLESAGGCTFVKQKKSKSAKLLAARLLACLVALLFAVFAQGLGVPQAASAESAQASSVHANDQVEASLISDVKAVQPGKDFRMAVELKMQPKWHTYYKDSGDAGMPTKIEWVLPEGFKASDLIWEKPEKFTEGTITTYGYQDHTVVAATITPPPSLPTGKEIEVRAKVKWLACRELCIPGSAELAVSLPTAATAEPAAPEVLEKFSRLGFTGNVKDLSTSSSSETSPGASATGPPGSGSGPSAPQDSTSIATYLACALIGGFILNFMPCVLPVIAIKVISLVEQAKDEPQRVRLLGLTFSSGIIVSFLALAGLVVGIKAAGQDVGWGFQFQHPPFVIAMATIVLVFALSLFGLFYISAPGGQAFDKLAQKEGFVGTFFKGVLATVLSTPCSAPFLGTALGFAFAQPALIVFAMFFTIGLGMSLPYLLLTMNPKFMRFMPRPGVWMEKFKESLGFILLATVVWLLGIVGKQIGIDGLISVAYFLTAVSFAVWLVSRFTDLTSSGARILAVWATAVVIAGTAFYFFVVAMPKGSEWEPFTQETLEKYKSQGKTVFVDFTAEWCLTCKMNENTVLNTPPVQEKMKELKVVKLKADWTSQDESISKLLASFNRSGVPLYVVYPANKPDKPIVFPEVITQPMVLQKLDEAGPSR